MAAAVIVVGLLGSFVSSGFVSQRPPVETKTEETGFKFNSIQLNNHNEQCHLA